MPDSDISEGSPITSWLNPKITLRESSIEGTGFFAEERIEKDECLIVQGGKCVHISEIDDELMEPYWYYGFQIERDVYLYPFFKNGKPLLEGILKINHCCEPNTGFRGQVTLVALRDIEVGEELTYDYAMTDIETDLEQPWTPQECHCGTDSCRKLITGNDWRLSKLHKKYQGYFSTHVTEAIKKVFADNGIL